MKLTVSRDELSKTLKIALKATSQRAAIPVLAGVLVDAQQSGRVIFRTTDFEIHVKHTIEAQVEEAGKVIIPAKLLNEIVSSLPDAAVSLETVGEQVKLTCSQSSFMLSTISGEEFPLPKEVETGFSITFPTSDLFDAVSHVSKAASKDDSRAVFTGIYFEVKNNKASCVASDLYLLAYAELKTQAQDVEDFSAIIPAKTLDDVSKISINDDQITISFSENQVVFTFGSTVFISRKIEGTYPNYKQLLFSDSITKSTIDVSTFTTAVKRVSLLAQASTPITLKISAEQQNITISSFTQDIGAATEVIPAQIEGESMEIAFNPSYIINALSPIKNDAVFEMQAARKPGIIRDSQDNSFLYLAIPAQINR